MVDSSGSEQELLEAETRRLKERGYTIYRGKSDLVPRALKSFVPDAIAVGREPKYVIEIVREGSGEVDKLKQIRNQLSQLPGWELLVILDRGARAPELRQATVDQIDEAIRSAGNVLASGEAAPSLLLGWGIFEALSRNLIPDEFKRPQSPGRLIQLLATRGHLRPGDEHLLRKLAKTRNAIIHGEFAEITEHKEVVGFLDLLATLRDRLEATDESENATGR